MTHFRVPLMSCRGVDSVGFAASRPGWVPLWGRPYRSDVAPCGGDRWCPVWRGRCCQGVHQECCNLCWNRPDLAEVPDEGACCLDSSRSVPVPRGLLELLDVRFRFSVVRRQLRPRRFQFDYLGRYLFQAVACPLHAASRRREASLVRFLQLGTSAEVAYRIV